ncbi:DMT family transporter [Nisaea sp.]|uniref:DMT family transporter n=1 Tax=Nisaea sp. TaxID=2024842 RepID=UPI0032674F7F
MLLGALAATSASFGWATGMMLAHAPARRLGAFEFTRIQLLSSGFTMGLITALLGYWPSVTWGEWPAFLVSILFGVILGNLAMIECLRRCGPQETELVISLKAPLVALMAFLWLGETLALQDIVGGAIVLAGIGLAVTAGANRTKRARGKHIVAALFFGGIAAVSQGVGFLALKPAMLAGSEPIALSAIRLLGAALLISLAALWPDSTANANAVLTPTLLVRTIIPGLIGYGISTSLLLYAFAHTEAGIAAVLGSLSPILILPIAWIAEGRRPSHQAFFGALLSVLGCAIMVLW